MGAIKFTERILIRECAEKVFDFTQDYNKRLLWDTFLRKAEILDGVGEAGKEVRTYCEAKNGMGMVTEYVTFNRPHVTAIKMTEGPFLFKMFLGSWTFKERNASETEVIFLYSFQLRFPFNLFSHFVKQNLQKNVQQRLVDLKNNIECKREHV